MTQWAPARRCTRKGQCARAAQPNQWLWSYEEDSRCLHVQSLLPAHHPRQEQGQVRLLYHLPVRDVPGCTHHPVLLSYCVYSHSLYSGSISLSELSPHPHPRSPCLLCFPCTSPRSPCLSPGCPPWLWMNTSIVPSETTTAWLKWKGPTWPVSPLPTTSCHLTLQAQVRGPWAGWPGQELEGQSHVTYSAATRPLLDHVTLSLALMFEDVAIAVTNFSFYDCSAVHALEVAAP